MNHKKHQQRDRKKKRELYPLIPPTNHGGKMRRIEIVDGHNGEILLTYCFEYEKRGLLAVGVEFVKEHYQLSDEQVQQYLDWRRGAHERICDFIKHRKIDVYYNDSHHWQLGWDGKNFYIHHMEMVPHHDYT